MLVRTFLASLIVILFAVAACAQGVETQSASPLGNANAGKAETAIGDLTADAVREALQSNIAFVAASELKPMEEPLPAGKISSTQVAALISYPNDPLAVLLLSGKTIMQALEKSVAINPQRNLGFLQVSGLKFKFDPGKPSGSRITSVTIGGSALQDDVFYSVGVTNSLANGALGYWKVWSKDDIKRKFADTTVVRAIEGYFRAHSSIDYSKQDRIVATP